MASSQHWVFEMELSPSAKVQVAPNERNYHCFYMLFHLPEDLQEHLGIKGLKPKQCAPSWGGGLCAVGLGLG